MKQFLSLLTIALFGLTMAACDSGLTENVSSAPNDDLALGKADKMFVCHVGNELPAYDPLCDPLLTTCGDAGKIDLIEVAVKAADQHLNNPSHCYDSTCDYTPEGDTGDVDAKNDTDGNYIDQACEVPEPEIVCPCWDATTLAPAGTCGAGNDILFGARYDIGGTRYQAQLTGISSPSCRVNTTVTATTAEVATYCTQLILDRCAI